jgi:hypothetical protein
MTKDQLSSLADYCKENITDYEVRVGLAIDKIAYWRASLEYVDNSLCTEMQDACEEWCKENEIDLDEDFDVEDLIWL